MCVGGEISQKVDYCVFSSKEASMQYDDNTRLSPNSIHKEVIYVKEVVLEDERLVGVSLSDDDSSDEPGCNRA